jgi:hypothetical protein
VREGRDVGVKDDDHNSCSGEGGVTRSGEIGQEFVEFLVGFPGITKKVFCRSDGTDTPDSDLFFDGFAE